VRHSLSLAVLGLLVNCATIKTPSEAGGSDDLVLKMAPRSLERDLVLSQHLTVTYENTVRELDAQLEVDAEHIGLVALFMGQPVATLNFDGQRFAQEKSHLVPAVISAERILTDVQLAFWPAEKIVQALPLGFVLLSAPRERQLLKGGLLQKRLAYAEGGTPAAQWRHISIVSVKPAYQLDIESIEAL
jgi:hypothetical protein